MNKPFVVEELRKLPLAMRHCPHCGRLVAFRAGVMDKHDGNGRGEGCPWPKRMAA